MNILAATTVMFPTSAFVPIAVGFFGLGTGYLIYGAQELFGLPERSRPVDITTGIWSVWMPGFMQFLTGVYLFVGLSWFDSFRAPALYMAALAFTAYGVHWFSLGLGARTRRRPAPERVPGDRVHRDLGARGNRLLQGRRLGRRAGLRRPDLRLRQRALRRVLLAPSRPRRAAEDDQRPRRAGAWVLPARHRGMAHVHDVRRDPQHHERDEPPDLAMAFLVSDAMITIPKVHPPDVALDEIRTLFEDDHVLMALIVAADGRLLTTIDRTDLVAAESDSAPVAQLGTLAGRTVGPSTRLSSATAQLLRERKRRLAVVDDHGRLVGLLCLKRDGTGFCTDEDVRARAEQLAAAAAR